MENADLLTCVYTEASSFTFDLFIQITEHTESMCFITLQHTFMRIISKCGNVPLLWQLLSHAVYLLIL